MSPNPSTKQKTNVYDTYYYDLLEVSPVASESEIKKGYISMARRWHPDKNPDPKSEEKFKEVSEAYQILKDKEKRSRYDQLGREGFKHQEQTGLDPRHILRSLFGAGKFDHLIGDLESFALMIMLNPESDTEDWKEKKLKEVEKTQQQKVEVLSVILIEKLELWVKGNTTDFEFYANREAREMVQSAGGATLLQHIGYLYEQEATQHSNAFFGLRAFVSEISERAHVFSETFSLMSSFAKLQVAEENLQKTRITGQEDEARELEKKIALEGLSTLWKIGKLEMETVIRKMCEKILRDQTVSKETCRKRAEGVERLGEIYLKVSKESETLDPFLKTK